METKTIYSQNEDNPAARANVMPREAAVAMREAVAKENRAEFMLERTAWNDSGFVNVQKIGNKFRARLQVPGDGRGGNLKRRQYPVPGIFDTAEDAAVALAITIRDVKASNGGKLVAPPLQNKPRKPSGKKPLQPVLAAPQHVEAQMPMATAIAMPIPSRMLHVPLVAASPLPMLPLCFAAPL